MKRSVSAAFAFLFLSLGSVLAESQPAKQPVAATTIDVAKLSRIAIEPEKIVLADPRSMQRVLVTGWIGDKPVDVTELAKLSITNDKTVKLNSRLETIPLANGSAELTATVGSQTAKVPVEVSNIEKGRPINFANEIVPIFTKLGCNSGGCHGKASGQNGFKLSLLGFEPQEDFDYLVKEARGRRLFPAAPEQSILLRKPSGSLPHGGGKLIKPGDDNFQLLVAWMKQGTPYGSEKDPVVTKIEVLPRQRVMVKRGAQRLRVTATYSDGRTEDVTRYTQFQSNDDAVATVDDTAKVTTNELSGEAAVMARYQGQVAVFTASVPVGLEIDQTVEFTAKNYVDQLVFKKWNDLGLVPSKASDDHQFIRRLTIDLAGRLPLPEEVKVFVESKEADKRDKLIDRLLASEDYAAFMAMKFGAVLQNKRGNSTDNMTGTHAMSLWLKDAFYHDLPYDQFARAVLASTGTPEQNPPVVWYRNVRSPEDNVDNVSQLFLGTRIQCARCHHHPFEKWSQDDYWGFAAFFSRMGRKAFDQFASGQNNEAIYVLRNGSVNNPKTGQAAKPKGLDAPALDVPPGVDPRQKLVDWMVDPKNPMFSKALVNRLWGHFFSRGIVEPIDDMRVTNPPSNPDLLDALAKDFVEHKFSIKHAIKTICSSAAYQLSSEPNKFNTADKQNFARYYPRRLSAEVLLDSIDHVTMVPTGFGLPAGMGAVDLPDEGFGSYFLDIFGRPQRASSCECERSMEANLSQALHLLNSNDIQGKLTNGNGRAAKMAADKRPLEERVTELFFVFFSRPPKEDELKTAVNYINGKPDNEKPAAFQNLIWALINTKEFQFNT